MARDIDWRHQGYIPAEEHGYVRDERRFTIREGSYDQDRPFVLSTSLDVPFEPETRVRSLDAARRVAAMWLEFYVAELSAEG